MTTGKSYRKGKSDHVPAFIAFNLLHPKQWFLNCGPQTTTTTTSRSSSNSTWGFVRDANGRSTNPRPTEPETLGRRAPCLHFSNPSRWFWCTLRVGNHWLPRLNQSSSSDRHSPPYSSPDPTAVALFVSIWGFERDVWRMEKYLWCSGVGAHLQKCAPTIPASFYPMPLGSSPTEKRACPCNQ